MSRTDKDRPYRVLLADDTLPRIEHHDHTGRVVRCITHEEEIEETYWPRWAVWPITHTWTKQWYFTRRYPAECTLNDLAPQRYPAYYRSGQCWYSLGGERYHSGPPKWYTDHVWNNPERVRVRDTLREAAGRWNAGDDLEDFDFPNYQHRHGSLWGWF